MQKNTNIYNKSLFRKVMKKNFRTLDIIFILSQLVECGLRLLGAEGCAGVHTCMSAEHMTSAALLTSLGFTEVIREDDDEAMVTLEVDLGGGGSSCQVVGDANGDAAINVLDVVLTVNLILCADCPDNYNECSDINSDGQINVLDVVSLVNIILGRN